MRLIKNHKYLISWADITTSNEWVTLEQIYKEVEAFKPCVNTWTYIGAKGNWHIFTSGSNQDGQLYDYHLIPKQVILKIKELK